MAIHFHQTTMLFHEIFLVSILFSITRTDAGILYPRDSKTRQSISLNGLWNFVFENISTAPNPSCRDQKKQCVNNTAKPANKLRGNPEDRYDDVQLMPVPASYNDISTSAKLRDHVGVVLYERTFFVPSSWKSELVWLRFSSVCYSAEVVIRYADTQQGLDLGLYALFLDEFQYVNAKFAMQHKIGHLPFEAEISSLLEFGAENNTIVVMVNNTLDSSTVPQGTVSKLASGRLKQKYTFDFFNYAGIDRPVTLYTTPKLYIDDITIVTKVNHTAKAASVFYNISVNGTTTGIHPKISLYDREDTLVASNSSLKGSFSLKKFKLWWPYLLDSNPGYLYKLKVKIFDKSGTLLDSYTQRFGIRQITWDETSLYMNGRKLYLRGFGKHEDSDIRGKGFDLPVIIRDFNLMKWVGGNAFRTSHYPYADEIMDVADQLGIMIIDECPAVDTEGFSGDLLANHKRSLTELYQRDKNHPSVIMWSAANEPRTQHAESEKYYKEVVGHIKSLDEHRPVNKMFVQHSKPTKFQSQFVDVVSYNRYEGWYSNPGSLDIITDNVLSALRGWHSKFKKPVIMQEYGADTLEGLHTLPEFIWSEDYQVSLMSEHFKAFDQLRKEGFLVGEFIWTFTDFKTDQAYTRVGGNKKGIFTRDRQPKAGARHLRQRYWALAKLIDNSTIPNDLSNYVAPKIVHQEL